MRTLSWKPHCILLYVLDASLRREKWSDEAGTTESGICQGRTSSIDCGSFGYLSSGIRKAPRAAPHCNLTPLPSSGVCTFPSLLAHPFSLSRIEQLSLSVFPASHPHLEGPIIMAHVKCKSRSINEARMTSRTMTYHVGRWRACSGGIRLSHFHIDRHRYTSLDLPYPGKLTFAKMWMQSWYGTYMSRR